MRSRTEKNRHNIKLEGYMGMPTAARIIGVSVRRLQQFIDEGRIDCYYIEDLYGNVLREVDVVEFSKIPRPVGISLEELKHGQR